MVFAQVWMEAEFILMKFLVRSVTYINKVIILPHLINIDILNLKIEIEIN